MGNDTKYKRARLAHLLLRKAGALIVRAQEYVDADQNAPLVQVINELRYVEGVMVGRRAESWKETDGKEEFDRQIQDIVKALEALDGNP